ncbi:hypothetical protein FOJ82_03785 [Tessaracoccus rhinocerotis]|uniref:DUF4352 domain-containing protein n=1 Tax=Tessaracoccus rhinocerotis TaxID=1689449 RepID=A0A553K5L5_9ACTN|nr:hypothetical protein [Tessaracoccus rhinocerotis]TRY20004.1 hypothetical protein FOJ82_03785 [Tessaracoccus rhinocerotis]
MARINPTVRTWLLTLLVVGAVLGVIALVGGFGPRDTSPYRVEAGQQVSLTRWDITLHGCEIEPSEDSDGGAVVIRLDATNRWRATLEMLEPAVGVELPTGEGYGFDGEWYTTRNLAGGGFDPGFAAEASIRLETEEPLWGPDEAITVSLFDESSDDGYLSSDRWYPSELVAVVDLVCTVLEVEE